MLDYCKCVNLAYWPLITSLGMDLLEIKTRLECYIELATHSSIVVKF